MLVQLRHFFSSRTVRLALTYLLVIMIMSVGFSIVFYHTSYHELGRQLPSRNFYHRFAINDFRPHVQGFFQQRIDEGRHDLLIRLVYINIAVLLLGALASYWLARRALAPIEASMEAQNRFVSDASHELRTPLTAIQTSNEVALRKPKLSLTEARKIIEQNSEDASRLQALTEGLLKLASGDFLLAMEAVSIQETANEAINTVLPLAQAKQIVIDDTTQPLNAAADQPSLLQVLTILLDNAIKYSPAKSKITLASSASARHIELQIVDHGAGIEASDLPYIFDRFYRADASRSQGASSGYGLGLAIADKLAREMNCQLSVASEGPGKGSTFSLKLPLVE